MNEFFYVGEIHFAGAEMKGCRDTTSTNRNMCKCRQMCSIRTETDHQMQAYSMYVYNVTDGQ